MAIRHVRAVQEYSRIEDDLTRHVLEVIALDIGRDDSPAYTSNVKIGRRVRRAKGTVRDCIQACIDSGELVAQKDGKYMFYSLNPELLPYGRTSGENRTENDGKKIDNPLVTINDLNKLGQTLGQKIEGLGQTLGQGIGSIGSTDQRGLDPEVRKVNEKEERTPQTPQGAGVVFECFENNIGGLNKETSDSITDAVTTYGEQTVTDAITYAGARNARSWRYVETVLRGWQRNGRDGAATSQKKDDGAMTAWQHVLGELTSKGHPHFSKWELTEKELAAFIKTAKQNGGVRDTCIVPLGVLNSVIKQAFMRAYNEQ